MSDVITITQTNPQISQGAPIRTAATTEPTSRNGSHHSSISGQALRMVGAVAYAGVGATGWLRGRSANSGRSSLSKRAAIAWSTRVSNSSRSSRPAAKWSPRVDTARSRSASPIRTGVVGVAGLRVTRPGSR